MGILLFDKNADYSTGGVGHAGLYTSVGSGLQSLFETRRSAVKTKQNSAPGNSLEAQIVGTPTFNSTSVDVTAAGQIVFPSGPVNTGENSFAVILKIKSGGVSSDYPLGSVTTTATSSGSCYFTHYNRRVQFETTVFNSQNTPTTYTSNKIAFIDFPSDGSLDGTFEMFVVTLKSENALRLIRPKTNSLVTTALTAGQFAYFNQSVANRNLRALGGGTAQQGISMVAHWNRVITDTEVTTFYNEIREQYSLLGLSI